MRHEVLNALLTAKTLFDSARRQCNVRSRHIASAGLVVLQDAVEVVFYACLVEIGIDEKQSTENISFDQLIGELKKAGLAVAKSGTLKAMNKQRVLIKHHAQLAEPVAVQNFYAAAKFATDKLLVDVIGKPLQHVVVADAVTDANAKAYLEEATAFIDTRRYLEAMIAIRKALFLAVEVAYDIRRWEDYDPSQHPFGLGILSGSKAPFYACSKKWIQENVSSPLDYIQLDNERVRGDMMELGIDPEEFFNVWRLTPAVYRLDDAKWAIERRPRDDMAATDENARYCLDVVVSILVNQQTRTNLVRRPASSSWEARLLRAESLLKRASSDSEPLGVALAEGDICHAIRVVSGFNGEEEFVYVFRGGIDTKSKFVAGYVPRDACDLTSPTLDSDHPK